MCFWTGTTFLLESSQLLHDLWEKGTLLGQLCSASSSDDLLLAFLKTFSPIVLQQGLAGASAAVSQLHGTPETASAEDSCTASTLWVKLLIKVLCCYSGYGFFYLDAFCIMWNLSAP